MRPLLLKVGATLLTLATSLTSAVYVTAHLKNGSAPLRPSVINAANIATANIFTGTLTLTPSIKSGDVQPLTSTYAS